MSKVYEALRQKQCETSGSPRSNSFEEEVVTLGLPNLDGDLEVADNVLRAAVCAEHERPYSDPAFPQAPSPMADEKPAQRVTCNGFRTFSLPKNETSRLVFLTDPHGLAAEQFRFIRRNLEQKFPHGGVLLITSPAPRDGKTLTSINLTACLGDSGHSTLLLEGDIRQPAVARVLGTSIESPGIEDALTGTVSPPQTVYFVANLSFHVSMVRNPPADPSRVVSGSGTKQYLAWAREHFHWVVIDSPPVLPAVDVAHLATLADVVLLVVRAQSTPRELLMRSFEMLGDRLSGVVMNEATVESNPYYRYLSDYRPKADAERRMPPSADKEKKS